jgi:hypothetical protein
MSFNEKNRVYKFEKLNHKCSKVMSSCFWEVNNSFSREQTTVLIFSKYDVYLQQFFCFKIFSAKCLNLLHMLLNADNKMKQQIDYK